MIKENIFPYNTLISKNERRKLNNHNSFVIWLTGISGSGKSTIANKLEEIFYKKNIKSFILDGDNLRNGLNKDLGFTQEDREENIRRISEVAKLFVESGIIVITAFISPYQKDRKLARMLFENNEFIEIYIKCSLAICSGRDVKGLYKKANESTIEKFTGIDDPYEEPQNPELVIDTGNDNIDECISRILNYLNNKNIFDLN